MSALNKSNYPVRWIPLRNLRVIWPEAQRLLNEAKVKRIMENFDPDAFTPSVVTQANSDGIHHVIDGQTGSEAVRRLWGDDQRVPCIVLDAKTPEEAAELFLLKNPGSALRSPPNEIDRFKVAVCAKREMEVEVNGLIHGIGWIIGREIQEGTMRAIGACMRIRKRFGIVVLKYALEGIRDCWGMDKDATHQSIISGFGEFFRRHRGEVDKARFVDRVLMEFPAPKRLVALARVQAANFRRPVKEEVASLLRQAYNKGLRTKRLKES